MVRNLRNRDLIRPPRRFDDLSSEEEVIEEIERVDELVEERNSQSERVTPLLVKRQRMRILSSHLDGRLIRH